jgi:hypothetical protein
MKRLGSASKVLGPVALLVMVTGLFGAGCVDNDQSIVILANVIPDDMCELPTSGGKFRGKGIYDIGLSASLNLGYTVGLRVMNAIPPSAGMAGGGGGMGGQGMMPIEMNHVQLVGYEVDIIPDPNQPITSQLPVGVPGLTKLIIPYAGGQITAGGGTITGPVEVINSNAASMLLSSRAVRGGPSTVTEPYQTLTVRVRARVIRGGGVIYSGWFSFPIEICAFCLARKPGEAGLSAYNAATASLLECPDPMMITDSGLFSTCLPPQDGFSTCCIKERQVLCGLQIPHKAEM